MFRCLQRGTYSHFPKKNDMKCLFVHESWRTSLIFFYWSIRGKMWSKHFFLLEVSGGICTYILLAPSKYDEDEIKYGFQTSSKQGLVFVVGQPEIENCR